MPLKNKLEPETPIKPSNIRYSYVFDLLLIFLDLFYKKRFSYIYPQKKIIPYLPTPPLGQDMTQSQFLSGV